MKHFLFFIFLMVLLFPVYAQKKHNTSWSDKEILNDINKHRPLNGAAIPGDIKWRLGATHVGGKYFFTKEPYIIEGCRKLNELGFGLVKLWFSKSPGGYPYNSNWDLPADPSLKQLAQHPYYKACFEMPFRTIVLSVGGAGVNTTDATAAAEEEEIYELTKYLLQTYASRSVDFILENWEGDWIMRGGTGSYARWSRNSGQVIHAVDGDRYSVPVPSDSAQRVEAMIKWFSARQRGVERARAEFPNTTCHVYHAVEANKVMDAMEGIPGIINYVLPQIRVDMVSWSSYDALNTKGPDNGVLLYKGIEYIKEHFRPSLYMKGKKKVFLGEIGVPEQRYPALQTKDAIVHNWDVYMGVCLALNVPYIIQWELYCNEPKDEALRKLNDTRKTDEMRGFWLIRPDGSLSYAAQYFNSLLRHAGTVISK